MDRYDPAAVEAKWQAVWEQERVYEVRNPEPGEDESRLMYVLEMLPYPSGELHMGHVKNYTMGDVVTLYKRRNGWRVMHPMGYDAFGLPAENAAIKSGQHPRVSTRENIAAIREQMKRMGWSIDWTREVVDVRARVLPVDAVDLPAAVRGRAGLPQRARPSSGARSTRRCWPTSR